MLISPQISVIHARGQQLRPLEHSLISCRVWWRALIANTIQQIRQLIMVTFMCAGGKERNCVWWVSTEIEIRWAFSLTAPRQFAALLCAFTGVFLFTRTGTFKTVQPVKAISILKQRDNPWTNTVAQLNNSNQSMSVPLKIISLFLVLRTQKL